MENYSTSVGRNYSCMHNWFAHFCVIPFPLFIPLISAACYSVRRAFAIYYKPFDVINWWVWWKYRIILLSNNYLFPLVLWSLHSSKIAIWTLCEITGVSLVFSWFPHLVSRSFCSISKVLRQLGFNRPSCVMLADFSWGRRHRFSPTAYDDIEGDLLSFPIQVM